MMMKLNKLTIGGTTVPVYLNPAHIVSIEKGGADGGTRLCVRAESETGESRILYVAEDLDAVARLCNRGVQ